MFLPGTNNRSLRIISGQRLFQSSKTNTLRHFVALLPQGRIQDQDHQEPNTVTLPKEKEHNMISFLAP
jgi:hypothetical protein